MFARMRRAPRYVGAFAVGLGVIGAAIGTGQANSSAGPLSCEIKATPANGALMLESVVHTATPLDGTYRFRVASAGGSSTNIQQGGGFSAGADRSTTLSRVTLAGSVAYNATLEVNAGGVAVACKERVGAI